LTDKQCSEMESVLELISNRKMEQPKAYQLKRGVRDIHEVACASMSASRRIVLKNSKIVGLRKSRKCSALAISAAARFFRIDTRASDSFCSN
jgi:hypothetical protein